MTLTIFSELEQGSDEWVAARCGVLTASQIGKLITPTLKVADNDTSRGLTETLVAERITGRVDFVFPNADMQRSTWDKPYCRDVYSEHFAPVVEVGFMTNTFNGHILGFSPDGLVGDDGLIEAKSRRPKAQINTILTNTVPRENMAQLQAGLLVSGREWIDYLSYSGGLPLYRKRVLPDPQWQDVILAALEKFEADAADMIERYELATVGMPATEYIDHYASEEMEF